MSNLPTLNPKDRRLNFLDATGAPVANIGTKAAIGVAFTELRAKPDRSGGIDTQLIFGETVTVQDIREGWAWVQADRDQYVGWLEETTLIHEPEPATHLVCVPRTFFYPEPDLKLPHKGMRSMGSALRIVDQVQVRGTDYAITANGEAIIARHIRPIEAHDSDYVSAASSLMRTPYLWAGTSAFGIDCSGLVKLAMFMCGQFVLRDSDMQAASAGTEIDAGDGFENIQRGDLIFWRGHVGICEGRNAEGQHMLLHANGHSMDVTSEPLLEAVERIAYLYEQPTGIRRP
jgi:cell wall-associated NlpC family hydrolase